MSRRGRGEGTIYRRKDGRWEGALSTDGRRLRWVANRRSEVQQQLSVAIHARDTGAPIPGRLQPFGKFWSDWLPELAPQVRPSTWQLYNQIGRSHLLPVVGSIPLAKLTASDVRRVHERMLAAGLSPTTASPRPPSPPSRPCGCGALGSGGSECGRSGEGPTRRSLPDSYADGRTSSRTLGSR